MDQMKSGQHKPFLIIDEAELNVWIEIS